MPHPSDLPYPPPTPAGHPRRLPPLWLLVPRQRRHRHHPGGPGCVVGKKQVACWSYVLVAFGCQFRNTHLTFHGPTPQMPTHRAACSAPTASTAWTAQTWCRCGHAVAERAFLAGLFGLQRLRCAADCANCFPPAPCRACWARSRWSTCWHGWGSCPRAPPCPRPSQRCAARLEQGGPAALLHV